MVYFESWDEFYRLSEELYRAAPLQARRCGGAGAALAPRARALGLQHARLALR
jgi:hypothetical protein